MAETQYTEIMNNLISLTGAFLTATGLFFAALGATATYNEPLKVFLSASALAMSVIWFLSSTQLAKVSLSSSGVEFLLGFLLPSMFILGWTVSFLIHAYRWFFGFKGNIGNHQ